MPASANFERMHDLFVLMAAYNEWMNTKVYAAASELSTEELRADRGAFFGSVFGTLNHTVVGDRIWLQRFAEHPARPGALEWVRRLAKPKSLDEILFTNLAELVEHRRKLDAAIIDWVASLSDADLDHVLRYSTSKGVVAKRLSSLVLHFFNHQTHHRGQVTTLLSQFGKDVGVTDLVALIPDEAGAASSG
jgi:uncharacterized damage-inducible protein DinB